MEDDNLDADNFHAPLIRAKQCNVTCGIGQQRCEHPRRVVSLLLQKGSHACMPGLCAQACAQAGTCRRHQPLLITQGLAGKLLQGGKAAPQSLHTRTPLSHGELPWVAARNPGKPI